MQEHGRRALLRGRFVASGHNGLIATTISERSPLVPLMITCRCSISPMMVARDGRS